MRVHVTVAVAAAIIGAVAGGFVGHGQGHSAGRANASEEWEDRCDDMLRRCRSEAASDLSAATDEAKRKAGAECEDAVATAKRDAEWDCKREISRRDLLHSCPPCFCR